MLPTRNCRGGANAASVQLRDQPNRPPDRPPDRLQNQRCQRRRTEQYGAEFHWTPEERRQHINITRIRRGLPFRRTPEAVDAFLDRLETECKHIESHDSDEFF